MDLTLDSVFYALVRHAPVPNFLQYGPARVKHDVVRRWWVWRLARLYLFSQSCIVSVITDG